MSLRSRRGVLETILVAVLFPNPESTDSHWMKWETERDNDIADYFACPKPSRERGNPPKTPEGKRLMAVLAMKYGLGRNKP